MNRKQFLHHSGILIGGTLLGRRLITQSSDPLLKQAPSFDLHTHPGVFFTKGSERYPGDQAVLGRIAEMKGKGLSGAFFALVADWPLLQITEKGIVPQGTFKGDEGWKVFMEQLNVLKSILSKSEAQIATKANELSQTGKVKAYLACEGGDFIGGKIERVEQAYEQGIRSIQLVHYAPNELGDLQTLPARYKGLSTLGKEVVKKMNELNMVIDVAHASHQTVKDVTKMTTAPIILSHSILKAKTDSPVGARAISKSHARRVADTGGVIGMWPSGFSASFDAFVDHTFRMIDVVGIDHVGMGTDMDANYQPVVSDYGQFFDWKDALRSRGLTEEEVGKVVGGNAKRLLETV